MWDSLFLFTNLFKALQPLPELSAEFKVHVDEFNARSLPNDAFMKIFDETKLLVSRQGTH
jgi:hypothetical protein